MFSLVFTLGTEGDLYIPMYIYIYIQFLLYYFFSFFFSPSLILALFPSLPFSSTLSTAQKPFS